MAPFTETCNVVVPHSKNSTPRPCWASKQNQGLLYTQPCYYTRTHPNRRRNRFTSKHHPLTTYSLFTSFHNHTLLCISTMFCTCSVQQAILIDSLTTFSKCCRIEHFANLLYQTSAKTVLPGSHSTQILTDTLLNPKSTECLTTAVVLLWKTRVVKGPAALQQNRDRNAFTKDKNYILLIRIYSTRNLNSIKNPPILLAFKILKLCSIWGNAILTPICSLLFQTKRNLYFFKIYRIYYWIAPFLNINSPSQFLYSIKPL